MDCQLEDTAISEDECCTFQPLQFARCDKDAWPAANVAPPKTIGVLLIVLSPEKGRENLVKLCKLVRSQGVARVRNVIVVRLSWYMESQEISSQKTQNFQPPLIRRITRKNVFICSSESYLSLYFRKLEYFFR